MSAANRKRLAPAPTYRDPRLFAPNRLLFQIEIEEKPASASPPLLARHNEAGAPFPRRQPSSSATSSTPRTVSLSGRCPARPRRLRPPSPSLPQSSSLGLLALRCPRGFVPSPSASRARADPIMFFLYNMERRVTLHPSYFGRNMHELVTSKLLKDVEGTCAGSYYIISIMDTFEISEGRILPGNGLAEFTVGYRAVVWRPFKGETVDAVVYSTNPQGFFAQAGPLRLFVSAHLIPSDIKWDPNATPPQFTNNEDTVIEPGTHVRVKIIGTRTEVGEMWAIGSIKEDYLGCLQE
ncbi:hypothetical protein XA68_15044 [Ophiocordyceps unilateralis]|uniref:DNA-directed RNA polymerase subunit n=1 Tax=Ophiocordyceps unilateralis TaxID=268505 RepID=A0A2A9P7G8_OPHUN|nr:hypothetical protein XA68_15044 [Ophiocordyceps unilateralis]